MKKKAFLIAGLALVAVVVVAGAIWGKHYYDDRYVGSDYYTMVPKDFDMTPIDIRNQDGKVAASGVVYELIAYNEQGETKAVSITVYDPDSGFARGEVQPLPGTYLWVNASKTLVVAWGPIDKSDVPAAALKMIESNS